MKMLLLILKQFAKITAQGSWEKQICQILEIHLPHTPSNQPQQVNNSLNLKKFFEKYLRKKQEHREEFYLYAKLLKDWSDSLRDNESSRTGVS